MDEWPGIDHTAPLMSALLSANEIRLSYGYQTLLDGVTLALVQGGLADEADRQGLVSLGAVAHEPLWIFHRQGLRVEGFWSFASTRIAGGPPGSGTRHVTDLLLRRHGLTNGSAPTVLPLSGLTAASALERGEVDMALLVAAPEAPAVQRLLRAPDVDLWHWRRAGAYAGQIPVLARLVERLDGES